MLKKFLIIFGTGGHTRSCIDTVENSDFRIKFLEQQEINNTGYGNSNGFTIQLVDMRFNYECN